MMCVERLQKPRDYTGKASLVIVDSPIESGLEHRAEVLAWRSEDDRGFILQE